MTLTFIDLIRSMVYCEVILSIEIDGDALKRLHLKAIITDLPPILILSVNIDFLPFEFGKILIFFLKIW